MHPHTYISIYIYMYVFMYVYAYICKVMIYYMLDATYSFLTHRLLAEFPEEPSVASLGLSAAGAWPRSCPLPMASNRYEGTRWADHGELKRGHP